MHGPPLNWRVRWCRACKHTTMSRLGNPVTVTTDTLNEVPRQAMSSILTAASDIALVLDRAGIIRDITLGQSDQPLEESKAWLGHGWIDTMAELRNALGNP